MEDLWHKMVNKYSHFFLCILGAFLLLPSISVAQDKGAARMFATVDDEIRYYLTEENYTLRHYDVLTVDNKALDRAKFLFRKYETMFIEQSKGHIIQAEGVKLSRLIWILMRISGPDYRPLLVLFPPNSFEATFKNAQEIKAALVQRLRIREPQGIYAVEALAALKYHSAIPEIISFLNYNANPDVKSNLIALADLDAKQELSTYVQQKVFEDLCIRKEHNVRYGIHTDLITKSLQELAAKSELKNASYFRAILQKIVWEPNEQALARYALEGASERLRGHSVLLLSHYRNQEALNVILNRLKNDPSNLVRFWAAQSFVTSPNSHALDTLITVYDQSADSQVRFGCIEALGKIGGDKAVVTLRKALNDKSQLVQDMARFRLAQLSSRQQRIDD